MSSRKVNGIVALSSALALAAGILAGCGSSSSSSSTQTSTAAAAETAQDAAADETVAATESSADGEKTVIHAATSGGPRPFVYTDEDGNLTGHNIELLKAVFEKLPQYELEISQTEFASIFTGIDAGLNDIGVNNISKNPEREAKYLYTDPIMRNHYIAVVNKDISQDITEINDLSVLAGQKYIGSAGNDKTTVVETYNDANPDQQITIDYTEEDLLKQIQDVESGLEGFLIIDEPMWNAYYEPEFHPDVNTYSLDGLSSAKYSYFIVSKNNQSFADEINQALREVAADGTAEEISQKYLNGDFVPDYDNLE